MQIIGTKNVLGEYLVSDGIDGKSGELDLERTSPRIRKVPQKVMTHEQPAWGMTIPSGPIPSCPLHFGFIQLDPVSDLNPCLSPVPGFSVPFMSNMDNLESKAWDSYKMGRMTLFF